MLQKHKLYTELMLNTVQVALEGIHEKGYIHHDVKPGNIVCNQEGATALIDFGTCTELADGIERRQGVFCGLGSVYKILPHSSGDTYSPLQWVSWQKPEEKKNK